ncbi:MAG TPA: AarF/UbiB family protein [Streptosporangiaceae bacterium]|nr:AarF/UbiB family protein [Streptosporangiaceae bacterium]
MMAMSSRAVAVAGHAATDVRVTVTMAASLLAHVSRSAGYLAPLTVLGAFVVVFVLALIARRLLGLRGGLFRTLLCAVFGLAVGGSLIGPHLQTDAETAALFPVMAGVQLLTTVLALLAVDAVLPRRSPVGWIKEAQHRFARARRYAQVGAIATRNGLVRQVRVRPTFADHERNVVFARALRRTLEEAGVTFVKLGQLLSTRDDLLPPEFIDELRGLQDEVVPVPWPLIDELLTSELGAPVDDLFTKFEQQPLAAASIGQVHRATLHSGERVVVKVQRPGITSVVERDLDIALRVASSLERRAAWARDLGAVELTRGFAAALREELDFRVEARNLTTIAESSARRHSGDQVRLPQLHNEFTTTRILVMELLDGVPLAQAEPLIAERGLDHLTLARTLLRCLLLQIMTDGVFHADPHPGNILLLADGQLALLDFGSVGHLDTQLQGSLQSLLLAIDRRDPAALRDSLLEITDDSTDVDVQGLERSLGRLMARYLSPGLIPDAEAFAELFRIVSAYGVAVPPEIAAVFRTLATLQGTLSRLAPGFDIVIEAQQFADRQITAGLSSLSPKDAAINELAELVPLLRRMPRRFDRITAAVERGQLSANIRLLADPRDREVISGYLHQALVCALAATTGIMAVVLLASQGGPLIAQGVRLYAVFGYNLLVISAVLMIRVLSARVRWRQRPRDSR